MNKLFLGIDTSNYTTSLAIVDQYGNIIEDKRKALLVKSGQKGLRQQEALFQHIKNVPELIEALETELTSISAIGVSTRPRNVEGSYMPVFLAGENFSRALARALGVPIKRFSHQEGHIGCCIIEENREVEFLSLHLSGGTTEVVYVENQKDNLLTETVGGTLDISMGQLIDRIGVHLGMNFPCGMELDRMAANGTKIQKKLQTTIRDGWVNLSGLENLYKNLLDGVEWSYEDVIHTMFLHMVDIARELIKAQLKEHPVGKVYVVGGVSANSIIRDGLREGLGKLQINFPERSLSTDNAVGIAYLAACKVGWEE
ncbi:MAG: hypothetical protein ACQEP4_00870 [Bacillota bacterium]